MPVKAFTFMARFTPSFLPNPFLLNMSDPMFVKEISVHDLKNMRDGGEDFQLIDVREPDEYSFCNLNGINIPLGEIANQANQIDDSKKVVVHCRSGARSAKAIMFLQMQHGFENLYNLRGGILAWADEIDPAVPKY
jgi:adenylyltransferase/sulfurtransferase